MTASSDWDSAFKKLTSAGVHVRTYKQDASLYIHAKMILVDGHRVFLGSQNFSAGSLDDNRELGIILSTGAIIRSLEGTFGGDYAHATPFRTSGHSTTSKPKPKPSAPPQTCSVSASWDGSYQDWNVYVQGPADVDATATADGHSYSYYTNSSGYADIYLYAPESAAGDTVRVTAGSASCTGTL